MINIHLLWQNNCLLYCVWHLWDTQREPQKWTVGRNRQIKVFNTCCGYFLILQSFPEDSGYVVWGCGFDEDYALIFSRVFRIILTGSSTSWQDLGFIIKFFPVGTINDRDSSGWTFYQHTVTPTLGAAEPESTHWGPVTAPCAVHANEAFWLCEKLSECTTEKLASSYSIIWKYHSSLSHKL